jgi:serine/threonine-protein kinase
MIPAPVPREVAGYRVLREIGAGGMGQVVEAEEPGGLRRRVALKLLAPAALQDPSAGERLRREALAMASLHHPHVAQVLTFHDGPPPFLVMELLAGESLKARIARGGGLPPEEACLVALQVLSALEAAHVAGIVHRDVKPANVFVVPTPLSGVFVKLLDFGLAKTVTRGAAPLTLADEILGSAPYMAPEQIRGEPVDARTDLFAMGATLYEMLAGRRAFPHARADDALVAILRGDAVAPIPGIPRDLAAIVDRSLARTPAARFLSAAEMARALEPFTRPTAASAVAGTAASAITERAPRSFATGLILPRPLPSPGPVAAPSPAPMPPHVAKWLVGGVVASGALGILVPAVAIALSLVRTASVLRPSEGHPESPGVATAFVPASSCIVRHEDVMLTCTEYARTSSVHREICAAFPESTFAETGCPRGPGNKRVFGCRSEGLTQWLYAPTYARAEARQLCGAAVIVEP